MINEDLKNYFLKNINKYSFEELKKSALNSGYSEDEIEELRNEIKPETEIVSKFYIDNKINNILIFSSILILIFNYFLMNKFYVLTFVLVIIGLINNIQYWFYIKEKIKFKYLLFTLLINSIYCTFIYLIFIVSFFYLIKITQIYLFLLYISTIYGVIVLTGIFTILIVGYFKFNSLLLSKFYENAHSKKKKFYNNNKIAFFFLIFFIIFLLTNIYTNEKIKTYQMSTLNELKNELITNSQTNFFYIDSNYNKSKFVQDLLIEKKKLQNNNLNYYDKKINSINNYDYLLNIENLIKNDNTIIDNYYILGNVEYSFFKFWNLTKNYTNLEKNNLLNLTLEENSKIFKLINSNENKINKVNEIKYINEQIKYLNIIPIDKSEFIFSIFNLEILKLNNQTEISNLVLLKLYKLNDKKYDNIDDKLNQALFYQNYLLKVGNFGNIPIKNSYKMYQWKDLKPIFKSNPNEKMICKEIFYKAC